MRTRAALVDRRGRLLGHEPDGRTGTDAQKELAHRARRRAVDLEDDDVVRAAAYTRSEP